MSPLSLVCFHKAGSFMRRGTEHDNDTGHLSPAKVLEHDTVKQPKTGYRCEPGFQIRRRR